MMVSFNYFNYNIDCVVVGLVLSFLDGMCVCVCMYVYVCMRMRVHLCVWVCMCVYAYV